MDLLLCILSLRNNNFFFLKKKLFFNFLKKKKKKKIIPRRMAAKSMGESAHKAKTEEGKKEGATRGRQDLKQMGRTAEATRGDRGVNFARERSTERFLRP